MEPLEKTPKTERYEDFTKTLEKFGFSVYVREDDYKFDHIDIRDMNRVGWPVCSYSFLKGKDDLLQEFTHTVTHYNPRKHAEDHFVNVINNLVAKPDNDISDYRGSDLYNRLFPSYEKSYKNASRRLWKTLNHMRGFNYEKDGDYVKGSLPLYGVSPLVFKDNFDVFNRSTDVVDGILTKESMFKVFLQNDDLVDSYAEVVHNLITEKMDSRDLVPLGASKDTIPEFDIGKFVLCHMVQEDGTTTQFIDVVLSNSQKGPLYDNIVFELDFRLNPENTEKLANMIFDKEFASCVGFKYENFGSIAKFGYLYGTPEVQIRDRSNIHGNSVDVSLDMSETKVKSVECDITVAR